MYIGPNIGQIIHQFPCFQCRSVLVNGEDEKFYRFPEFSGEGAMSGEHPLTEGTGLMFKRRKMWPTIRTAPHLSPLSGSEDAAGSVNLFLDWKLYIFKLKRGWSRQRLTRKNQVDVSRVRFDETSVKLDKWRTWFIHNCSGRSLIGAKSFPMEPSSGWQNSGRLEATKSHIWVWNSP